MARILYGISGDGFGHAARSQEVIRHLEQAGHKLLLVSYDRGYQMLSKSFTVHKITGLRLKYERNEVKYLATVAQNLINSPANLKSLNRVLALTKKFRPQLVITDFEPTVTLAANWLNLPLISLDNMHILTKAKLDIPAKHRANYLTAKLVIRLMVVNASRYIVLSFFPAKANSSKAIIAPPIIRQEILGLKPSYGEHILVYLTAGNSADILPILRASLGSYIIYGLNKTGTDGNLTFKNFGARDYLKDLANSRAIIATAGFSLVSEALYLAKPYLALTIKSQFEQFINGYYLQKLGYGMMTEVLDHNTLKKFLKALPRFTKKLAGYHSVGNQSAFKSLDQTIEELL
jgi:uncharacterized protein (TIGR00661 family)